MNFLVKITNEILQIVSESARDYHVRPVLGRSDNGNSRNRVTQMLARDEKGVERGWGWRGRRHLVKGSGVGQYVRLHRIGGMRPARWRRAGGVAEARTATARTNATPPTPGIDRSLPLTARDAYFDSTTKMPSGTIL